MRSAEVRAERAFALQARGSRGARRSTRPGSLLVLLNLVAIVVWPSWDTITFHLISICFALLYGLRVWPADPMLWGMGIVVITTLDRDRPRRAARRRLGRGELDVPLLATMFVAVVWHANGGLSPNPNGSSSGRRTPACSPRSAGSSRTPRIICGPRSRSPSPTRSYSPATCTASRNGATSRW